MAENKESCSLVFLYMCLYVVSKNLSKKLTSKSLFFLKLWLLFFLFQLCWSSNRYLPNRNVTNWYQREVVPPMPNQLDQLAAVIADLEVLVTILCSERDERINEPGAMVSKAQVCVIEETSVENPPQNPSLIAVASLQSLSKTQSVSIDFTNMGVEVENPSVLDGGTQNFRNPLIFVNEKQADREGSLVFFDEYMELQKSYTMGENKTLVFDRGRAPGSDGNETLELDVPKTTTSEVCDDEDDGEIETLYEAHKAFAENPDPKLLSFWLNNYSMDSGIKVKCGDMVLKPLRIYMEWVVAKNPWGCEANDQKCVTSSRALRSRIENLLVENEWLQEISGLVVFGKSFLAENHGHKWDCKRCFEGFGWTNVWVSYQEGGRLKISP